MSQAKRTYIPDAQIAVVIAANFKKNAKTADVCKGLRDMGYSAAPNRINRVMGRYTKKFCGKAEALTANKRALLDGVKAYAVEHYEDGGWDIVAETFNDQEILDVVGESWTVAGAVKKVAAYIAPLAEQRAEVIAAGE